MNAGFLVALTGASGSVYGLRLLKELVAVGASVTFTASPSGLLVCREEAGLDLSGSTQDVETALRRHLGILEGDLDVVPHDDICCFAASGSSSPDAMIIAPCSMGTLARVAGGISGNLIERAADVMLKERRPLLLVPRETPLSDIHLENMLRLSRAGARIIPAMPAFYHHPGSVEDMVAFMTGKILDQLGIEHDLFRRWG